MESENTPKDEPEAVYEAPKLVVLGSVEELTHATLEIFADLPEGSRPLIPR
jgi:hypothetical protein